MPREHWLLSIKIKRIDSNRLLWSNRQQLLNRANSKQPAKEKNGEEEEIAATSESNWTPQAKTSQPQPQTRSREKVAVVQDVADKNKEDVVPSQLLRQTQFLSDSRSHSGSRITVSKRWKLAHLVVYSYINLIKKQ